MPLLNKISLLKFLDRSLGKPIVRVLSLGQSDGSRPVIIRRVLIIRPGGIGDAVLLLPSIRALKARFPDSCIDILCEKRNAGIFDLVDGITHLYRYDSGFDLFLCLKKRYDVVIDTEQWHRFSAIVAFLTRATIRIGFTTNDRERLFTEHIPYSHDDYEVYSFFHLIKPLTGFIPEFNHDEPFIDVECSDTTEQTVAISPGATVKERRWGGERYGEVAKGIIRIGYRVIIVGSDRDKDDAGIIKRIAPEAIDMTGKTSLKDLAKLLKGCVLLITADSGLLHMAVGVGTPTISLFGSGIEKKWAPRGSKHRIINKHLSCSPCTRFGYTPECIKRDCLNLITPDEVLDVVLGQLHHIKPKHHCKSIRYLF